MLGLPEGVTACLFDLDGVLTQTAKVHAAAWKEMFDGFLKARAEQDGTEFVPFDARREYDEFVDGKPRDAGVRDVLASRGITIPEGSRDDPPTADTVNGLGTRKNALVLDLIARDGVDAYAGSIKYLIAARDAGLKTAVVSSSHNCKDVLAAAEIGRYLEMRVDGHTAETAGLQGKPSPDTFLEGARLLGVDPREAAVFEDALAGVAAGRAGRFGVVVGVNRVGQREALLRHGADVVVDDLEDLL
jgi:beta-phosphoglucomutase family hydrolase